MHKEHTFAHAQGKCLGHRVGHLTTLDSVPSNKGLLDDFSGGLPLCFAQDFSSPTFLLAAKAARSAGGRGPVGYYICHMPSSTFSLVRSTWR